MSESEMGVTAAASEARLEAARRLFKVDPFILINKADADEYPFDMVKGRGSYDRKKDRLAERAITSLYTTSCPPFCVLVLH